ncbi:MULTISPECIES: RDD family protein [Nocardiopsis]|uniref:RDD family protein n=1 Tax=Nocardiopsis TaxID=2013 RepID=UPI00034A8F9B|nr:MULTISPECIES: RDD family protein [Nocardiopsis]PWV46045.1 putative RDD family membrane protein YckC [Nocardiopsis sp. L17-MgMaSL7]
MNASPHPNGHQWGTRPPQDGPPAPGPAGTPGPEGGSAAGPVPPAAGVVHPLASWWARAAARCIDAVVIALPALLISLVLALTWAGAQVVLGGSTQDLDHRFWFILWPVMFVLHTAYETYAVSRWQQTYGKRRMGLKVAPLAAQGGLGPIRLSAVTVRAALYGLPILLFFTRGLWFVFIAVMALLIGGMAAWDRPNRQGLHDRIAGTVVLDVGSR